MNDKTSDCYEVVSTELRELAATTNDIQEAKNEELKTWKGEEVYIEVEDKGQLRNSPVGLSITKMLMM